MSTKRACQAVAYLLAPVAAWCLANDATAGAAWAVVTALGLFMYADGEPT